MADKSLIEINQRLTPKGGISLSSPEDYNDDLQDLETLVNDMLTYRGESVLPSGNMSLEKYEIASEAMSTCTCNNRTYVDPQDCAGRTACSCNIRSTSCGCQARTNWCYCITRSIGCNCQTRGFGDCPSRGTASCGARTACTCNSRTGAPLDIFG